VDFGDKIVGNGVLEFTRNDAGSLVSERYFKAASSATVADSDPHRHLSAPPYIFVRTPGSALVCFR
jgi:hypothetical protein